MASQLLKKYRKMPFLIKYAENFNKSQIMEKIIPREITSGEHLEQMYPNLINLGSSQSNPDVMEEDQTKEYNKTDINAINESVGKPIYDLLDRGGKQWRPLLGLMFAEQFGRNIEDIEANKDIYFASGLTEIIHNGSLMVDDLQDGSLMRRGDLCSYKKFGIDVAVNTGNLMYLAPMCQLEKFVDDETHHLPLHKIYTSEMQSLHFGQNWDIHWHNKKGFVPTEAMYFHMVENKTSVLPRMCLKFISQLTNQTPEMRQLVTMYINSLGAAFQIQDDLIAVTSEEYRKERGVYCEDVQEGKRTLMIIYSFFYGWKGDGLIELLDQKSSDEDVHKKVIRIIQEEGGIEYASEKARLVIRRAWNELEPHLKNGDSKDDIHELSQFLINRHF